MRWWVDRMLVFSMCLFKSYWSHIFACYENIVFFLFKLVSPHKWFNCVLSRLEMLFLLKPQIFPSIKINVSLENLKRRFFGWPNFAFIRLSSDVVFNDQVKSILVIVKACVRSTVRFWKKCQRTPKTSIEKNCFAWRMHLIISFFTPMEQHWALL